MSPAERRRNVRSKSFTGCWTCRSRKVKCDERRPICARCQKAGLTCQGYHHELAWRETSNALGTRAVLDFVVGRRRAALHGANVGALPPLDPSELQARLAYIDATGEGQSRQNGPFAVFPIMPDARQIGDDTSASGNSGDEPTTPTDITHISDDDDDDDDVSIPDAEFTRSHDSSKSSSPRTPERGIVRANVPSMPFEEAPALPVTRLITRHIDLLPAPRIQSRLLHYWAMRICDEISAVPGTDNPLRTVFMPMCLEGVRSGSENCNAFVALFHAVCAASAFYLAHRGLEAISTELAIKHHNLSLIHLRHSLTSTDCRQQVAILATLSMCIIIEANNGPSPQWRTHFEGGMQWLKSMSRESWTTCPQSMTVYQLFVVLLALARTQSNGLGRITDIVDLQCTALRGRFDMPMVYGLSYPIFQAIVDITEGTDDLASRTRMEQLELELYLSLPSDHQLGGAKTVTAQIAHHQNAAFHYAALIYLKRTIYRDSPFHSEIQDLVRGLLTHLETVDSFTVQSQSILWVVAMGAYEATAPDLQARFDSFMRSPRRCQLTVYAMLRASIQAVWDQRLSNDGASEVAWQSVTESMPEYDVMLI